MSLRGVPEVSVDGNDEGPANLRSVGPGAKKWVLGSRLGLDSESERTHHVLASSLLIGQFSPQTLERLSSSPRQQLQQRAQVRSCAEQQICAMLCEAFRLVRLASAGQGLGWQNLTSMLSQRPPSRCFWGRQGCRDYSGTARLTGGDGLSRAHRMGPISTCQGAGRFPKWSF